ncbi:MAG: hypothetical protein J0L75_04925 [Spirochaetes bacterium]|nr:hypothetical protein [Spirochaetota bacterium]
MPGILTTAEAGQSLAFYEAKIALGRGGGLGFQRDLTAVTPGETKQFHPEFAEHRFRLECLGAQGGLAEGCFFEDAARSSKLWMNGVSLL